MKQSPDAIYISNAFRDASERRAFNFWLASCGIEATVNQKNKNGRAVTKIFLKDGSMPLTPEVLARISTKLPKPPP